MRGLIGEVAPAAYTPKDGGFGPVARYDKSMDFLLYINEDCAYRADRVDAFLTVLWHPDDERLVGLKLKGFKFLFQQLKAISDSQIKESDFLPLVKVLEIAMVGGVAEAMMQKIEDSRLRDRYAIARKFANDEELRIPPDEYLQAA